MSKMPRRVLCLAPCLSVIAIVMAMAPGKPLSAEFRILPAESRVQFRIGHLGIGVVTGRFDSLSGTIGMNPSEKSLSGLEISIPVRSLNTGIGARDEALLGEGYLRAERFPNITFQSVGFSPVNAGVTVTGKLTLRGVTKTVALVSDAPLLRRGPAGESQALLAGRCTVKRKEIGLQFDNSRDADEAWLGDAVEIEFVLALQEVVP